MSSGEALNGVAVDPDMVVTTRELPRHRSCGKGYASVGWTAVGRLEVLLFLLPRFLQPRNPPSVRGDPPHGDPYACPQRLTYYLAVFSVGQARVWSRLI